MTDRDLFNDLTDIDNAQRHGPQAVWLTTLVTAGRDLLNWQELSLAEAEYRDGLYVDYQDAINDEIVKLAADDEFSPTFPAEYGDDTWHIVLGRNRSGIPTAQLLSGPSSVTVVVDSTPIDIRLNQTVELPQMTEPPRSLHLDTQSGSLTLPRLI